MESVGEFFRQVRETKGLTVDEMASKTRIRTDFVKAFAEGNFAKLPDQVFARGFVRSYARSLGLDEEDAIHRFVQSAGAFYEKQGERERLRQRQIEEERRRKPNRKAVGIAIAVAIATLVFLLSREQSSTLVRRSGSDQPPTSKKSAPFAKDTREAPRQGLELPPTMRAAGGEEIRTAQGRGSAPAERAIHPPEWVPPRWVMRVFPSLPFFVRKALYWDRLLRDPFRMKRQMGTVAVTAVGMFADVGSGSNWGIPIEFHPLTVALGAITRKPAIVGERVEPREFLGMTLMFDHDVIDGAPMATFLERLRDLIESGYGVDEKLQHYGGQS